MLVVRKILMQFEIFEGFIGVVGKTSLLEAEETLHCSLPTTTPLPVSQGVGANGHIDRRRLEW